MRTYVPSNCGVERMKLRTYLPIKNKYQINDVRTYPLPDFLVNVLRTYPGKGIDVQRRRDAEYYACELGCTSNAVGAARSRFPPRSSLRSRSRFRPVLKRARTRVTCCLVRSSRNGADGITKLARPEVKKKSKELAQASP